MNTALENGFQSRIWKSPFKNNQFYFWQNKVFIGKFIFIPIISIFTPMWDSLYKILYINLIGINLKHAACTAEDKIYKLLVYKLYETWSELPFFLWNEKWMFNVYLSLKTSFAFMPCSNSKHTRYKSLFKCIELNRSIGTSLSKYW